MDWRAILSLVMLGCGGRYSVATNDAGPPLDAGLGQLQTDKVDIVFVIDNSSSMGTKQDLLRRGVSDFLDRIIFPPCVTDDGKTEIARVNKDCPTGYKDKYIPINDVHVGIVTSSLGGGGSADTCDPNAPNPIPQLKNFNRHNDDRGHLINRTKPDPSNPPPNGIEDVVANAYPANFLAWLPAAHNGDPSPFDALRESLHKDFGDLVGGVQEYGCGLEAQLEAFYRFLIQPDPWDRIELDPSVNPAQASLVGIDQIILQQRHDFLRPDSLVAVIVVTDEEDSWSDPMWLKGHGWITRSLATQFSSNGQLPRGTAVCSDSVNPNDPLTGPNNPTCTWCGFGVNDSSCKDGGAWVFPPEGDGLNVRYTDDMKRRYGMNPQFPVERYIAGLTSSTVPDRAGEHTLRDGTVKNTYVDRRNCVNPLFAKNLPTNPDGELCSLEVSNQRNESLLFFGIIGGVPWQLLTDNPMKGGNFKSTLDDSDWRRILGKDPETFQLEGIDPHMIESIKPRNLSCGVGAPDTCDPFHGREYDTSTTSNGIDLQYACVFDLTQPIDCSKLDPNTTGVICDCIGNYKGPLCAANDADNGKMTLQIRGKAYPTIRELRVAQGLGARAIVGSICPKVTMDVNDKDFGYRPALRALVEHMQVALKAPTKNP